MNAFTTRRVAAAALFAAAGLLVTACGSGTGNPSEGAEALPSVTASATGDAQAGVAPVPQEGESDGPQAPQGGPSYPGTAQAYAQAVMTALAQDDWDWFGELTTPETYDQLIELPASVDSDWVFHRCDGAAGSSFCSFINDDGDALAIQISNGLIGQAHAAVAAILDATEYPGNGLAYVKEFVAAWKFGNTVRMQLLATPAVVDDLPKAPTAAISYPQPDCCTGGIMTVNANWGGVFADFEVKTSLLGGPHAIVGFDTELGFSG